MKFIDNVLITVVSGNGGKGAVSFRRERFIPKGGPDGGEGGDGGDVIIIADHNVLSLLDFRYKPKYPAENGRSGQGANKKGRNGHDINIKVPVGTSVIDFESNEIIADLTEDGERFIICKGGRGGKGNAFFKSSTNRRPRFSQPGMPGETKKIYLVLKSIGDIGIIGLPNAGKSTLISKLSKSHPEISSYPFTTKSPNLGVSIDEETGKSFVIVDIPGIMEGASDGYGLGIIFLKHIERAKILLHLIEIGKPDEIINKFNIVVNEINKFNKDILTKKQIVVINKIDTIKNKKEYNNIKNKITEYLKPSGIELLFISASQDIGLDELKTRLKLLVDY
ncbi:MAG: GTPase ObgE [Candidatus Acididesulfobacter diazotrophicus]|jgi:GTP-binding protein|uniref:GTPase Obg n=1 Tax=Candidatus Acididesulfobacter diazotrophicus TaxID=2597226 RepID=A0A519BME2_9DELT|nr:MAG: GTPase ObgE [Candidatus Acididesulfobacter diazotrophicus]